MGLQMKELKSRTHRGDQSKQPRPLTARQQFILWMDMKSFSGRDIARALKVKENAAKSALRRARIKADLIEKLRDE